MSHANKLIQIIKHIFKKKRKGKNFSCICLTSLELLLNLKRVDNTTSGSMCLQQATQEHTPVVAL